ncbi:MAG: hypothetical protein ACXWIS_14560 [Burkholderiales bacterium]
MVIKSDAEIYRVLEKHLKATKNPMTCVDLYSKLDVKNLARDANKVSDFLGHMWRRGLLKRAYAPKTSTSFARYAYTWQDEKQDAETAKPPPPHVAVRGKAPPHIEIDEKNGSVTVTSTDFVITIHPRREKK